MSIHKNIKPIENALHNDLKKTRYCFPSSFHYYRRFLSINKNHKSKLGDLLNSDYEFNNLKIFCKTLANKFRESEFIYNQDATNTIELILSMELVPRAKFWKDGMCESKIAISQVLWNYKTLIKKFWAESGISNIIKTILEDKFEYERYILLKHHGYYNFKKRTPQSRENPRVRLTPVDLIIKRLHSSRLYLRSRKTLLDKLTNDPIPTIVSYDLSNIPSDYAIADLTFLYNHNPCIKNNFETPYDFMRYSSDTMIRYKRTKLFYFLRKRLMHFSSQTNKPQCFDNIELTFKKPTSSKISFNKYFKTRAK